MRIRCVMRKSRAKNRRLYRKQRGGLFWKKRFWKNFLGIWKMKHRYKRKWKDRVKRKRTTQRGGWTNLGLWGWMKRVANKK